MTDDGDAHVAPARLVSVIVGGTAAPWTALGFAADGATIPFWNGAIECAGGDDGVVGLRVVGGACAAGEAIDMDGVTVWGAEHPVAARDHPNRSVELDHLVIRTPSLDRTSAAVERVLGLPLRRIREAGPVRQAFHRFPERGCIVELVEQPDLPGAALWGLVVNCDDLRAFVAAASPHVGEPKDAVQIGRRIATLRREAGLPCAVAVMSV